MVEMAQVAYEAFAEELTKQTKTLFPGWNDLSNAEQDAWRAAVEAIA